MLGSEAGRSDLSPPTPQSLLLEPSAHLFLSRCSLLKKKITTPPPCLSPTPARPPWRNQPVQVFPPFPTAATGPDKCAGQAGPRVTPPAHQHPGAPAGKLPTSGPHAQPGLPGCRTRPRSLLEDLPAPASRIWGLPWEWPVRPCQSGPMEPERRNCRVILTERQGLTQERRLVGPT